MATAGSSRFSVPSANGVLQNSASIDSSTLVNDEEVPTCPLCMEDLDQTDRDFFPCPCDYQVCLWCLEYIKTNMGGKCPACRRSYDESRYRYLQSKSSLENAKTNVKPRHCAKETKAHADSIRKDAHGPVILANLKDIRVIQRNLCYVLGLPPSLARKEDLKKIECFARYGTVTNIVVTRTQSSSAPTYTAYVTFSTIREAIDAIRDIDGSVYDGRTLRASFGTTKYCSYFLRGLQCLKHDCFYLHQLGNTSDSFTKEEMVSSRTAFTDLALPSSADDTYGPVPDSLFRFQSNANEEGAISFFGAPIPPGILDAVSQGSCSGDYRRVYAKFKCTASKKRALFLPAKKLNLPALTNVRENDKAKEGRSRPPQSQSEYCEGEVASEILTPCRVSIEPSKPQSEVAMTTTSISAKTGAAVLQVKPSPRPKIVSAIVNANAPPNSIATTSTSRVSKSLDRGHDDSTDLADFPVIGTETFEQKRKGKGSGKGANKQTNPWQRGRSCVLQTVLGQQIPDQNVKEADADSKLGKRRTPSKKETPHGSNAPSPRSHCMSSRSHLSGAVESPKNFVESAANVATTPKNQECKTLYRIKLQSAKQSELDSEDTNTINESHECDEEIITNDLKFSKTSINNQMSTMSRAPAATTECQKGSSSNSFRQDGSFLITRSQSTVGPAGDASAAQSSAASPQIIAQGPDNFSPSPGSSDSNAASLRAKRLPIDHNQKCQAVPDETIPKQPNIEVLPHSKDFDSFAASTERGTLIDKGASMDESQHPVLFSNACMLQGERRLGASERAQLFRQSTDQSSATDCVMQEDVKGNCSGLSSLEFRAQNEGNDCKAASVGLHWSASSGGAVNRQGQQFSHGGLDLQRQLLQPLAQASRFNPDKVATGAASFGRLAEDDLLFGHPREYDDSSFLRSAFSSGLQNIRHTQYQQHPQQQQQRQHSQQPIFESTRPSKSSATQCLLYDGQRAPSLENIPDSSFPNQHHHSLPPNPLFGDFSGASLAGLSGPGLSETSWAQQRQQTTLGQPNDLLAIQQQTLSRDADPRIKEQYGDGPTSGGRRPSTVSTVPLEARPSIGNSSNGAWYHPNFDATIGRLGPEPNEIPFNYELSEAKLAHLRVQARVIEQQIQHQVRSRIQRLLLSGDTAGAARIEEDRSALVTSILKSRLASLMGLSSNQDSQTQNHAQEPPLHHMRGPVVPQPGFSPSAQSTPPIQLAVPHSKQLSVMAQMSSDEFSGSHFNSVFCHDEDMRAELLHDPNSLLGAALRAKYRMEVDAEAKTFRRLHDNHGVARDLPFYGQSRSNWNSNAHESPTFPDYNFLNREYQQPMGADAGLELLRSILPNANITLASSTGTQSAGVSAFNTTNCMPNHALPVSNCPQPIPSNLSSSPAINDYPRNAPAWNSPHEEAMNQQYGWGTSADIYRQNVSETFAGPT